MPARLLAMAALAIGLCVPPVARASAEPYAFDADHTNVTFSWNHLGLSRQSARIMKVTGALEFDPEKPEDSRIDVTLDVASIQTGSRTLDRDLRSPDFFDAARYPEITFRSTIVRVTGQQTGEVAGNLMIMGQSQPVILQVRWNYSGEHPLGKINPAYLGKFVSGFSALTTIKRSQWGINRAVPLVSDDIEIAIEAEFLRKGS
jgi:polyisoprenoid-binding protein YceI